MNEMEITIRTIILICSGIIAIGGGLTYILKLMKPIKCLQTAADKNACRLDKQEKSLYDLSKAIKVQNKCLLALIDHEISGNSIQVLKDAKQSLRDYLVEK